eukprot:15450485-Alexandrium_andersonii.AAC.1
MPYYERGSNNCSCRATNVQNMMRQFETTITGCVHFYAPLAKTNNTTRLKARGTASKGPKPPYTTSTAYKWWRQFKAV